MPVSVTKEGPYFNGGSAPSNTTNIKFSQMRDVFKLDLKGSTATGSDATSIIKASELRRNTDGNARDPIVPDAVINEDIAALGANSLKNNWKVSQMRNSIKRFWATQSGTDVYFAMGRYSGPPGSCPDSSNCGIDWGGYGVGGRDSTSSGNGNLTKNIQKFIKIEGTCGATDSGSWGGQGNDPGAGTWSQGTAAARLSPVVPARNVRIWVYGSILGAGGEGGYDSRGYHRASNTMYGADPGTPGGIALRINNPSGNEVWVDIKSNNGKIWGGGGGGEQGRNGDIPQPGECKREWETSGCGSAAGCGSGESISTWSGGCCTWYQFCNGPWENWCNEHCGGNTQYRLCREIRTSTIPTQGIGGRGGDGQGYQQNKTNGQAGTNPAEKCPTCDSGFTLSGGACTTAGNTGGDGGDWGSAGENTSAGNAMRPPQPSNGGTAGPAICGSNYNLRGIVNGNTVKGSTNTSCGTTQPPIGQKPTLNMSVSGSGPWVISWTTTNNPYTLSSSSSPTDAAWNPLTPPAGSITVNPASTTTYNLTVQNAHGTASGSVTVSNTLTVWSTSRAASWQNTVYFNKYQGSGQSQIVSTLPVDQTTGTQQLTVYSGAKYRLRHRSGDNATNWYSGDNDIHNNSEPNGQAQSPVVRIEGSNKLRIEDGSNDTTHPDGRSWIDYQITTNTGSFSVDGHTDWPLYVHNLHSRNNNRNWISSVGGTTWYKVTDPTTWNAWSGFMKEYAVWVSENSSVPGTYTYPTHGINIPTTGQYMLAWQCDNYGTITFDGTSYNHNSHVNTRTDVLQLTAGTHNISFSVTNTSQSDNSWQANPGGMAIRLYRFSDGVNVWSTRDNVAGTTTGGNVSDQAITFWDGSNPDANATYTIASKDSSITEAKFVEQGRKLRIKGGGNITMRLEWTDNPGDAGVALDYIELWNARWTRSGTQGSQTQAIATCGGDIIYTR